MPCRREPTARNRFLLAPGGVVVRRFRPRTEPDAPEVVEAIEAVLPK